ncbi:hypothetical protein RUM43_009300, partial [Polyplax serrata]
YTEGGEEVIRINVAQMANLGPRWKDSALPHCFTNETLFLLHLSQHSFRGEADGPAAL